MLYLTSFPKAIGLSLLKVNHEFWCFFLTVFINDTVVKWGHTEGIEREKTSSQNAVPAKSKCNALRFLMKNYKFCSIDAYFLILFFKGSKVICQRGKTFFFHQKSEGIAFTFCRYLNQNMRAFKFCRYCLQIYFLMPSNFDGKKYRCILRAIPWEFWDEVFSLNIWGHLYNPVHFVTLWLVVVGSSIGIFTYDWHDLWTRSERCCLYGLCSAI